MTTTVSPHVNRNFALCTHLCDRLLKIEEQGRNNDDPKTFFLANKKEFKDLCLRVNRLSDYISKNPSLMKDEPLIAMKINHCCRLGADIRGHFSSGCNKIAAELYEEAEDLIISLPFESSKEVGTKFLSIKKQIAELQEYNRKTFSKVEALIKTHEISILTKALGEDEAMQSSSYSVCSSSSMSSSSSSSASSFSDSEKLGYSSKHFSLS